MFESNGVLLTDTADRYLLRLCKHWSHKFKVTYTEHTGHVDFGGSTCAFTASPDRLEITLEATQNELAELEEVVVDHLQRFAPPNLRLHVEWHRSTRAVTGAAGTRGQP